MQKHTKLGNCNFACKLSLAVAPLPPIHILVEANMCHRYTKDAYKVPDNVREFEESGYHVYQCSIKINNVDVVTGGGCLTKDESVMRAADSAAKLISRTKLQATRTPSQHM